MPLRYAHAGEAFDRFMADARDALNLQTSHQTYTAVQAVLWVFRRRLDPPQIIAFAQVLLPVLSDVFLQDWVKDEPRADFSGDVASWTREVQAVRAEHNFAPDRVIGVVARVLRRHVDEEALDTVLARLPAGAARFLTPEA
ncbi:MAG: DUF2267 domain-containing protein [Myxococcota bacterium]